MERQLYEYLSYVSPCSHCTNILSQDFAVFDYTRGKFYVKEQNTFANRLTLFACGAIAGVCALTVTDPLEFVRIRLAM